MHTACVWSVKLPFAEYSIVKELLQSGLRPEPRLGRSRGPYAPLRSLAARWRSRTILSRASLAASPHRCGAAKPQKFSKTVEPESRAGVSGAPRGWRDSMPRSFLRRAGGSRGPSEAASAQCARSKQVENTGLEPVTSWLQTRRSPS